ncbi:hypothetical protein FAI41_03870 [Acetobacteraceae bacterium]|nr:hypothetical protein FAI41_03870 [Acetobacteraceae bacterium]
MSDTNLEFKIAMLAPSRIGKTSLVTALLQDTKKLLEDTPLSLEPKNAKTRVRINQHMNQLRGSLREGEFDTGAMSGTEAPYYFNLSLGSAIDEAHKLDLTLLDFPGGWVSRGVLLSGETQEQIQSAEFIKDASVLLLVVDASLVMEAGRAKEKSAIDSILDLYATGEILEAWSKAKKKRPDHPSLVLICPVKCESYFDDNGGTRDKREELFNRTLNLYKDVIETVYKEGPENTEILYMPVDTIGCVEFLSARWDVNAKPPVFSPSFRVCRSGRQSVFGARDILLAVAKQFFHYHEKVQYEKATASITKAEEAQKQAQNKNIFESIFSLFGRVTENEKKAARAAQTADEAIKSSNNVVELLNALCQKDYGPRVKIIRPTGISG